MKKARYKMIGKTNLVCCSLNDKSITTNWDGGKNTTLAYPKGMKRWGEEGSNMMKDNNNAIHIRGPE